MQAKLRKLPIQFYPGHLHIIDRARQQNSRQSMNLQMLSESRAGAGNTLMKKQCVLVHETERDEFGKAARLFLNLTKEEELIYSMRGGFHVPIHQRCGATNSSAVSCADDFFPLFCGQFVAR